MEVLEEIRAKVDIRHTGKEKKLAEMNFAVMIITLNVN
jgi:hypothetical protein